MSNDYNKIFAKDIEKLEEEVPKTEVNEEGEEQESAPHPKQVLYVELSGRADKYDILRRKEGADE